MTVESIIADVRAFITKDGELEDESPSKVTDAELTEWIKEAAYEVLQLKKHLLVDSDGNPTSSSRLVSGTDIAIPEKYHGALVHGCLMFLFANDHARSSFERGLFYQQLGVGGRK